MCPNCHSKLRALGALYWNLANIDWTSDAVFRDANFLVERHKARPQRKLYQRPKTNFYKTLGVSKELKKIRLRKSLLDREYEKTSGGAPSGGCKRLGAEQQKQRAGIPSGCFNPSWVGTTVDDDKIRRET